jgi:hypothetical protein
MELQRRQDVQRVFQELESLTQNNGTIIKNQKIQEDYLEYHSGLFTQVKQVLKNIRM